MSASLRCDRCGHRVSDHDQDRDEPRKGICRGIHAEGGRGLCRCTTHPDAFAQDDDEEPEED